MVAARDAVGLRVAAAQARPRPDHARARRRVPPLPGDAHDRHQARRQRAVHVLARRQSARRADPRAARLLGRLRRDGRAVPGRRCRPRPGDLDDRRRPRRQRHGYLGDGRRPLRRLRDARLHQRQGPGELSTPVPDHLPERGAARRAAAADDADPRPPDRRQRGVGRDLRAGARPVVPARGPRADGGRDLPTLQRVGLRRRGGPGRPRAGRHDRDLELRQVPGHRPRRGGVAVVAADAADAGAGPHHPDRDAQRGRPDRRGVHGGAGDRRGRVPPVRVVARGGPPLALVPPSPARTTGRCGSRSLASG